MNDENTTPPAGTPNSQADDSWKEIGQQFQTLGTNLAAALRAAWNSPETQHTLSDVKTGVESMLNDVGKAINDLAQSPEGQKVRSEVSRAAESARLATEKAVKDAQPHVTSALQQLNGELDKLTRQWSQARPADSAPPPPPPGDTPQN